MLKGVASIMQQFAPAFIVVCVLLCLSFNYTFPLNRHRSDLNRLFNGAPAFRKPHGCLCSFDDSKKWRSVSSHIMSARDPTESAPLMLPVIGSHRCVSNKHPRKIIPTDEWAKPSTDADGNFYLDAETPNRRLSGDDLRQYEQLVIMKKYPYLDLKEFEPKYRPLVKNVKYVREADVVEGGDCQLTDDEGPHVEIFSRGISGFAIPRPLKSQPDAFDVKFNKQNPRHDGIHPNDVHLRGRQNMRILQSLKKLAENDID